MHKTKVAFFGTSDRSQPILEKMHADFDLILCVTKPDRIIGRHQTKEKTQVKKWAKDNNVAIFEIENFKKDENALIKALGNHGVELIIVADFGFIVGKGVIDKYKGKIINIHFSLLPKYRGANPVQATIIQGDTKIGITYLLMTAGLDEGPILHQMKYKLNGDETSGELYEILFKKAAENLSGVVEKYLNKEITPVEQDHKKATFYYSPSHRKSTYIYKEDARIDWKESAEQIERKIRAFNPWPIGVTTVGELENNNKTEKIKLKESAKKSPKIKIYSAKVQNEKLIPEIVQVEGKGKISWSDFKNGYCRQPEK